MTAKSAAKVGLVLLILAMSAGIAYAAASPPHPHVWDAITAANEEFMALFAEGDAAGVAALYTEDGELLPPNFELMAGREAIQAFWQGAMDMGISAVQFDIIELDVQGDTVIEKSTYTLFDAAGNQLDRGKYIVVWKREVGVWRLHRDIFNSSLPAP